MANEHYTAVRGYCTRISRLPVSGAEPHAIAMVRERWQAAVIALLQAELADVLPFINAADVDWDAWEQYYDAGRTPRQAVSRALERDL